MATNRTEQYGLHLWEPGDDFLREEFNENFAALDAAARVVTGVYTGDGAASQSIELGGRAKAIIVTNEAGMVNLNYTLYGGVAFPGYATAVVTVTATGFAVYGDSTNSAVRGNILGAAYHYIALF